MKKTKALFAVFLVLAVVLLAIGFLAPVLATNDPLEQELTDSLMAPCEKYPMGADPLGRCEYSRLLYGLKSTLTFALLLVALKFVLGTTIGIISGFCGGWVDNTIMRIIDCLMAFPNMVLAIAIVGVLGLGWYNTLLALLATGWVGFARISRGLVITMRQNDYLKSARLSGNSTGQILRHYIFPNIAPQMIVLMVQNFAGSIMSFSGLVFLGLGLQPPTPELGVMMSEGMDYLMRAPWMVLAPGLVIFASVMIFNVLGDLLRDLLDPSAHTGVPNRWERRQLEISSKQS